mgnify:CR=1 FL=1
MTRFALPSLTWRRARLGVLAGACALLLGACATGQDGAGGGAGKASGGGASSGSKPSATAPASRAIGPATTLRCGKQEVTVRANSEQAELTVGSRRYLLQAQRSASGARYASSAYPGTSYWSKGDNGMLMIEGQAFPECVTQASATPVIAPAEGAVPPRDLTVREWVVESIDGRGVVDNSRTTLTFDAQGQIAGRAGCNRYTGSYRLQGAQFSVHGVATTRMICVPALMDQESRFLRTLEAASTWRLQPDGSLLLSSPDGRKLLAR